MPAQQPPNAAMKENTALFPELKPCPFCGGKPELRFDNFGGPGCYILCACNSVGVVAQTFSFSTVESASDAWNTRFSTMPAQQPLNAVMKENTAPSLELNPCPNCGWSETDEHVFQESVLEYQQNFPDPSLWRKILRRISDGPVLLSDLWYYACIQLLFTAFEDSGFSVDLFNRIVISFFVVGTVVISRFVYRIISDWKFRLMFEDDLSLP